MIDGTTANAKARAYIDDQPCLNDCVEFLQPSYKGRWVVPIVHNREVVGVIYVSQTGEILPDSMTPRELAKRIYADG